MARRCWLIKSEPDEFSIEDLAKRPRQSEPWTGVRNYQARNFMRDEMRSGDPILFYHSNCAEPGVVGLAEVASPPYPDPTAFDSGSPYFDSKSSAEDPRWLLVDVRLREIFPATVTLAQMKSDPALAEMLILRRGNRLSITPVGPEHFDHITALGRRGRPA